MRKLRFIIAVMMISCFMAASVYAAPIATATPDDLGGGSTTITLGVFDGQASVSVSYTSTSNVTGISFYVHLYQDGVGYREWIESSTGTCFFNETANVESGHTYTADVKCFVYTTSGDFNYTVTSNSFYY